jgi:hypothetical protein
MWNAPSCQCPSSVAGLPPQSPLSAGLPPPPPSPSIAAVAATAGMRTAVAAQAQGWRSATGSGAAPATATVRACAAARVTTRGSVVMKWRGGEAHPGRSRGDVGVATSKSSTWGRERLYSLLALALARWRCLRAGSQQGEHVSGPQRFPLQVPPPQGGWNMSPAPTPPLSELL